MAKKSRRPQKPLQQELDMVEHAHRMRLLSGTTWDTVKSVLIWLAAGILIFALGWLALGR